MKRLVAALALFAATTARAAITATVLDSDGKPLAGARVRAFRIEDAAVLHRRLLSQDPETAPIATATTNAAGRVSVDVRGEVLVGLVVDGAGRAVQTLDAIDGSDAGPLVLRRAPPRKGRVTSRGDGVANALVAVGQWYVTRTDAHGYYEVPAPAAGVDNLVVIHPDYAIAEKSLVSAEWPLSDRRDIELWQGVTITGRVLAPDGRMPVPHAVVFVSGWPLGESDEQGRYVISNAHPFWNAVAAKTAQLTGVAVCCGPQADIIMAPGVSLRGNVRSGSEPVAGVVVTLYEESQSSAFPAPEAVTGRDGGFSFGTLSAARYQLIARRAGYEVGELQHVTVPATRECLLTATPLLPVHARVEDASHRPVAGARLFVGLLATPSPPFSKARGTRTSSSPTGELNAYLPPEVSAQLLAFKPGYAVAIVGPLWTEDVCNTTIELPAGFPVTIHIVDGLGQPVRDAEVMISQGSPHDPIFLPCSETSDDCRLTNVDGVVAERLVDGAYNFSVDGDDIVPQLLLDQVLTASSPLVTIAVKRKAEVSGRVLYDDGAPAAGASIQGPSIYHTTAAADGTFTLGSFPAGWTSIRASSNTIPVFTTPNISVSAPAGDVVLTLPRTTVLSGRVTEAGTGHPIVDFDVATSVGTRNTVAAIHSADGSFVLQAVPGLTELRVTARGYVKTIVGGLTVEARKPLTGIEVQLDRGGAVVGHVFSHGQPVAGIYVAGEAPGFPRQEVVTRTNLDGLYVLEGVKPGTITLTARKALGPIATRSIAVKGAEEVHFDIELEQSATSVP